MEPATTGSSGPGIGTGASSRAVMGHNLLLAGCVTLVRPISGKQAIAALREKVSNGLEAEVEVSGFGCVRRGGHQGVFGASSQTN